MGLMVPGHGKKTIKKRMRRGRTVRSQESRLPPTAVLRAMDIRKTPDASRGAAVSLIGADKGGPWV
jgi:hypothetical protein